MLKPINCFDGEYNFLSNFYNPIWDEEIRKINNPEEAYEVFNDAEDLYNFLKGNN